MTSVEAIKNILSDQVEGYKELLELLKKEKACLIDLNADCVEELSKSKDVLVLRLRLLEEERVRLMQDFGDSKINLVTLGELTGNTVFLEIRSKLVSLFQSIDELNQCNKALIERSLTHIKNNLQFFAFFGIGSPGAEKGVFLSGEM